MSECVGLSVRREKEKACTDQKTKHVPAEEHKIR